MQRIALTSLASLILLTSLTGCSLFKKKDATADAAYDPMASQPVAAQDPYPYPMGETAAVGGGGRYHTVQKKETLCQISRQYYGSPSKWKDIYAANRSEIGDPNKIRVGQKLMIP